MTLDEVAQISLRNQELLQELLRGVLVSNLLALAGRLLEIGILVMLWRGESLLRRRD